MDVRVKLALECVDEADPIPARCVTPQTSLREAFGVLEENHGGALVCHEGMLVGIFTERDALRALAEALGQFRDKHHGRGPWFGWHQ